jgi:hypothetical protein
VVPAPFITTFIVASLARHRRGPLPFAARGRRRPSGRRGSSSRDEAADDANGSDEFVVLGEAAHRSPGRVVGRAASTHRTRHAHPHPLRR